MNPLSAPEVRGNWATLVTPWNDDESLDLHRLAVEIDAMIAFGVDGIYSNGTAGEFHCQTEEDFDRISQCLAGKCHGAGVPFQLGVSHMSAQISLDRLRRAVPLAPSAVPIILPDWFPLTDGEAVHFLQRMADAAGEIRLVLYNPPHAKRRLTPADLTFLAEAVPQLVGVKVPGGDDAWYEEMQPLFSRLSVFIPGHTLASGFARGAHAPASTAECSSMKASPPKPLPHHPNRPIPPRPRSSVFVIYFTHPYGPQFPSVEGRMPLVDKRSSIQAAELEVRDGKLACDRDRPFRIDLGRP